MKSKGDVLLKRIMFQAIYFLSFFIHLLFFINLLDFYQIILFIISGFIYLYEYV